MDNSLVRTANIIAKNKKLTNNKKLPTFFLFTDRKRFKDIFQIISFLPKNTAIIIREYDLDYKARLDFINKVKAIACKKSLPILIAKNLKLALETNVNGVHFTDFDKYWFNYLHYKKSAKRNFLFTCCCHNAFSLQKADKLGMDAIFYSPIFNTQSHPKRKSLGVMNLRKSTLKTNSAIYALGGINEKNIKLLKNCAIAGIAGISLFNHFGS